MSLALDDLESCTQRQVKFRLTVAVFQEVVLDPLNSTAGTVDKAKNAQSLGNKLYSESYLRSGYISITDSVGEFTSVLLIIGVYPHVVLRISVVDV